jgi:hypothetical protein
MSSRNDKLRELREVSCQKEQIPRPLRGRGMTNHEVYGTAETMPFQISLECDFFRNL